MKHKVLQVLFNGKITMELKHFRRQMLDCDPEEIWDRCYEIDTKITIYELLVEVAPVMLEEQLQALISFQGVLDYLYEMWLTEDDSHVEDLKLCVTKYLTGTRQLLECWRREEEIIL